MRWGLGLLALGVAGALGVAWPMHRLHAGPMTVVIPDTWAVTGPVYRWGSTVWTATGHGGHLTLTISPLQPRGSNVFQLLPPLPVAPGMIPLSPPRAYYCQAAMGGAGPGQWQWSAQCLGRSGTAYGFQLELPDAARPLGMAIVDSWRHPAPASVTTAVRLLEDHRAVIPTWAESFAGRADGWLLVGGIPATAQEPFYLFRTWDGGRHWSLERYTTWTPCPAGDAGCVFPGTAGPVAMAFLTARVGVIVQGNYARNGLTVFRTGDAGVTWHAAALRAPVEVERVTLARRGALLVLSAWAYGQRAPRVAVSDDGGVSWRWTS
jgi:hypothetical protein